MRNCVCLLFRIWIFPFFDRRLPLNNHQLFSQLHAEFNFRNRKKEPSSLLFSTNVVRLPCWDNNASLIIYIQHLSCRPLSSSLLHLVPFLFKFCLARHAIVSLCTIRDRLHYTIWKAFEICQCRGDGLGGGCILSESKTFKVVKLMSDWVTKSKWP